MFQQIIQTQSGSPVLLGTNLQQSGFIQIQQPPMMMVQQTPQNQEISNLNAKLQKIINHKGQILNSLKTGNAFLFEAERAQNQLLEQNDLLEQQLKACKEQYELQKQKLQQQGEADANFIKSLKDQIIKRNEELEQLTTKVKELEVRDHETQVLLEKEQKQTALNVQNFEDQIQQMDMEKIKYEQQLILNDLIRKDKNLQNKFIEFSQQIVDQQAEINQLTQDNQMLNGITQNQIQNFEQMKNQKQICQERQIQDIETIERQIRLLEQQNDSIKSHLKFQHLNDATPDMSKYDLKKNIGTLGFIKKL